MPERMMFFLVRSIFKNSCGKLTRHDVRIKNGKVTELIRGSGDFELDSWYQGRSHLL